MAKKRHIAAKFCLDRPDLRILDIGCGWGGLALTLARDYGARVTGITLSREQLAEARDRAIAEGLEDRVTFELMDYRAVDQTSTASSRSVCSSMSALAIIDLLRFGGAHPDAGWRCADPCHRTQRRSVQHQSLDRQIHFPGGYCPSLSRSAAFGGTVGLVATDIEILRLHYAQTLRQWRWRFNANRDTIASIYDERFCRMFEFYLCGSELAFRRGGHMVFQIQLGARQDAVPLTRDYLYAGAGRIGVSSPVSL